MSLTSLLSSGINSKPIFAPGTNLRIHPLLDWTELNIGIYRKGENSNGLSLL
jgi:3'-phosphoadenosine 5'-phosphosulfate sulfotransferase (PAPS reductase)/FAD synthetase